MEDDCGFRTTLGLLDEYLKAGGGLVGFKKVVGLLRICYFMSLL